MNSLFLIHDLQFAHVTSYDKICSTNSFPFFFLIVGNKKVHEKVN